METLNEDDDEDIANIENEYEPTNLYYPLWPTATYCRELT